MDINDLLKEDKYGIKYIDDEDVNLSKFTFNDANKSYEEKRLFYLIDGIKDYIIKDTTYHPIFFNGTRNRNLLQSLSNKQSELPDIDFPIAYYRREGIMRGTVIFHYIESLSLRKVSHLYKFDDLQKFYNHDSNKYNNLIYLFLELLNLLERMYNKGVIYTDVRASNFLIYQNQIKVIDFEPRYMFFSDKRKEHYDFILMNYMNLVDYMCRKLGFKNVLFNRGETFEETRGRVLALRRDLER